MDHYVDLPSERKNIRVHSPVGIGNRQGLGARRGSWFLHDRVTVHTRPLVQVAVSLVLAQLPNPTQSADAGSRPAVIPRDSTGGDVERPLPMAGRGSPFAAGWPHCHGCNPDGHNGSDREPGRWLPVDSATRVSCTMGSQSVGFFPGHQEAGQCGLGSCDGAFSMPGVGTADHMLPGIRARGAGFIWLGRSADFPICSR